MDACLSYTQNRANLFDPPPVIVAATGERARDRAVRIVEASGLRLADAVSVEDAPARIEAQATATAVWLEADRDPGAPMDDVIRVLNRDVAEQRYSAVVSASPDLLEPLSALLSDDIQLLIDADEAECTAALALATVQRGTRLRISDVTADKSSARLRQLSDEVNRIAATLARLSTVPASPNAQYSDAPVGDAPPVHAETVRAVIRARRLRERYFPGDLFADPAWDMMLDLLQAEIAGLRVPVTSLCIAAAVPATTALRWLRRLVREGLFVRRPDSQDGRRVFVELSPETSDALRRYFADVETSVAI